MLQNHLYVYVSKEILLATKILNRLKQCSIDRTRQQQLTLPSGSVSLNNLDPSSSWRWER